MIPQRIKLRGFLCYREEQDIAFSERGLWMLSGNNGSGKSSVFDAATYALFGHHRGGSSHAGELINKDSNNLLVEFEFLLDGQHYRIRRTLQRNARGGVTGTQIIARRRDGADGNGRWEPLEDTSRKAHFDTWIRDNIGLSYETFTSSVLLLQGKAEKLLDSTAKGRFEVLAGIVGLEHYEKLHRLAYEEKKAHEIAIESSREHRAALQEVTPEALERAENAIKTAELAREQAQSDVDLCQALLFQAKRWNELQVRLSEIRQRAKDAENLLADSAGIEAGVARLRELGTVVPHVQVVIEQRQHIQDSERRTAELTRKKEAPDTQLAQLDASLEQTRRNRTALEQLIQTDEKRRTEANSQYRQVCVLLERVKQYEQYESDRAAIRAELARLPAAADDVLKKVRLQYEELSVLAGAIPSLTRLHECGTELRQASARAEAADKSRQNIQERGAALAADVERLRPGVEGAARTLQQAETDAARAQTLLEQATASLAEIDQMQGASRCRHCGQELSPGHLHEEKLRRERELSEAKTQYQRVDAVRSSARAHHREASEQLARLERQLQTAREEYLQQRHQTEQARKDTERLQRDSASIYGELPVVLRENARHGASVNGLETAWPTDAELAAFRGRVAGVRALEQRLRKSEEVHQQRQTLLAREADITAKLARLQADLPREAQRIRQDHARLEVEEKEIARSLEARRAEQAEIHKQLERLTRDCETARHELADLAGKLATEERSRQHLSQALDRALKCLSPAWRTAAEGAGLGGLYAWKQERDALEKKGLEARAAELQQARVSLEILRVQLADLEKQQDQFTPAARVEPITLQEKLTQLRQSQQTCDRDLAMAQQHQVLLKGRDQQRQELAAEIAQQEKAHKEADVLVKLTGRDRLQMYVMRRAERQVVDYANAALDRLSGGQLHLRLVGEAAGDGNSAKALELEAYNRATGERPINVAFLSGSQKFRVAVSLALGIGQFASRRRRPIESVIIDEGFGCLDREGRQVMIQELQNLRGHLRCILLVSHQEDFASAFADGYRFELANGATRVSRLQS